ncbi:MAG: hypothetical protein R2795_04395 [Saprospiraceae bacterium]
MQLVFPLSEAALQEDSFSNETKPVASGKASHKHRATSTLPKKGKSFPLNDASDVITSAKNSTAVKK